MPTRLIGIQHHLLPPLLPALQLSGSISAPIATTISEIFGVKKESEYKSVCEDYYDEREMSKAVAAKITKEPVRPLLFFRSRLNRRRAKA